MYSWSAKTWKILLSLYPPLMLNGIRVKEVSPDFKKINLILRPVLLNRNLHGSIFGGSIFSSFDPFFPLMMGKIAFDHGINNESWLKSATIFYYKPIRIRCKITFQIKEDQINKMIHQLNQTGVFEDLFIAKALNAEKECLAEAHIRVHIKTKK